MEKVLFIGNGINQVSENEASWTALMNQLAGKPETPREIEIRKAKPFTLWFEELSSRAGITALKGRVAATLEEGLKPNEIHSRIMALGVGTIITTNYDYGLEQATGDAWKLNMAARENYFSLFRRRSFESRHIWHIHGELGNVSSIMLGHEQYSNYINKIRNFLSNGVATRAKGRDGRPYVSRYSVKDVKIKGDVESWVDTFLENEVHVIGYGLDYSENHVWNLITEKRRLRNKRSNSIGRVVFHRCADHAQTTAEEAKLSILRALDVKVVDHTAPTYKAAYERCIGEMH